MPAVLRLKLPVKNVAKQVDMSYQQKLRGLYCHPIAPVLVASSAAAFYPFIGLATWPPTIAVRVRLYVYISFFLIFFDCHVVTWADRLCARGSYYLKEGLRTRNIAGYVPVYRLAFH